MPAPAPSEPGAWPVPRQPSMSGVQVELNSQAPQALTTGLPDPKQIEVQRGAYMRGLDEQLKQGADVLNQQLKQQQEYLLKMGDQQKRQYGLQVDQGIKQKELELVQQHNHQLLMLQQAAQQQKVALEQQANALLIEYNQKKAAEDLSSQMYTFENEAREAHAKYTTEIQSLQMLQGQGAQQLAAQGEALARQASISNMQAIAAQQIASRTSASLTCPMPRGSPPGSISYMQPVGNFATPPPSYLPPVQPGPPPMSIATTMVSGFPRSASRTGMTGMIVQAQVSGTTTPRTARTLNTYTGTSSVGMPLTQVVAPV